MGVEKMLKTQLFAGKNIIPLNKFTERYVRNILRGIISSLGSKGKRINVYVDSDELVILVNDKEVPLRKDFSKLLVKSTIKGMISPLRGIPFFENINIKTTE